MLFQGRVRGGELNNLRFVKNIYPQYVYSPMLCLDRGLGREKPFPKYHFPIGRFPEDKWSESQRISWSFLIFHIPEDIPNPRG